MELTADQIESFQRDGFLIVDRIISPEVAARTRHRYDDLFAGRFETGLYPDEWNWRPGSDPSLTRQICNGWKSDRDIASVVLDPEIGRACARLGQWPGTRLSQDNVLWKPPGGRALGFHQDSSYEQWAQPSDWVSCWIALDDTCADGGTIEYVSGSHRWSHWGMIKQFHGPHDPHADLRQAAAAEGAEDRRVAVEVPAGGGAFHSGWTWHGSAENRSPRPRRALVAHCMSSETRFHPSTTGYIYSRYKRFGDDQMDESFFPITWREDGYRSAFLQPYLNRDIGWAGGSPTLNRPATSRNTVETTAFSSRRDAIGMGRETHSKGS